MKKSCFALNQLYIVHTENERFVYNNQSCFAFEIQMLITKNLLIHRNLVNLSHLYNSLPSKISKIVVWQCHSIGVIDHELSGMHRGASSTTSAEIENTVQCMFLSPLVLSFLRALLLSQSTQCIFLPKNLKIRFW